MRAAVEVKRRSSEHRPTERTPERSAPSQLTIGRVNDSTEVEADRFADSLLADLHARPTLIARPTGASRAAVGADRLGGTTVDRATESKIRSASGGRSLPEHVSRVAERQTGVDPSTVRIHTDRRADELSRSLDATAFTVGTDIFFSQGSYRPGTAEGDHLVAHELAHVVQQGGGAHRRIRRFPRFGKKKKDPSKEPANQPDLSGARGPDGRAALTKKDLEKAVKALEKSLQHLLKKRTGTQQDWSAAYLLRGAAQDLMDKLPDQDAKSTKMLGRVYDAEASRIRRVIDEAQLVYDEYRVQMTKQKAGKIYEQAGRDSATPGKGGFEHLTGAARASAFDEVDGSTTSVIAKRVDEQAKLLGLSKAEAAAIATFTAEDYRYINPATVNSESWMRANRGAEVDTKKKSLFEEGSLHTGMAMQGLAKMPVWTGLTYRGETVTKEEFENRFEQGDGGKLEVKQKKLTRGALSSTTKEEQIARNFLFMVAKCPPGGYRLLYENILTNGRDIEPLSLNAHEKEVATLPGAEFEIVSAETDGMMVRIKVKQVR